MPTQCHSVGSVGAHQIDIVRSTLYFQVSDISTIMKCRLGLVQMRPGGFLSNSGYRKLLPSIHECPGVYTLHACQIVKYNLQAESINSSNIRALYLLGFTRGENNGWFMS